MGTEYSIYAEVRVKDKWYSLNPLVCDAEENMLLMPILSGRSRIKEAVDELEDSAYAHGRPVDLSKELRSVFHQGDEEDAGYGIPGWNYKKYYKQMMFIVNYGKTVKKRINIDKPTHYRGYVTKHQLANFEIGEIDNFSNWLTSSEYEKLTGEEKKEYTFFEWNTWGDWYGIYNELVQKIDVLLQFFNEWAFTNISEANLDERQPTSDYVRLIIYRE